MQPDRVHLAGQWRSAAAEDLRVADMLAAESPSIAAFHAQQAAEKTLKAACIIVIDDAPRTHVLNDLLDELAENAVIIESDVRNAARTLDRYYAPTRYPDALGGIDPNRVFAEQDARGALVAARTISVFADRILAAGPPK